jgi:RNA polymerase sigma-70 factor (ECF subfamily)
MFSKTNLKKSAGTGNDPLVSDLFERHYDGIFRYLYYRVGDYALAEDLTSEVFLRMIRALPGYKQLSVPIQAWLYQIARNLAIDHYRKSVLRQDLQLVDGMQTSGSDLDETIEKGLTVEKLHLALARLPENQREVVILRFIVAMPVADVAFTLHKSEDSVKGLQRRALDGLREILSEWEVVYV